MKKTLTRAMSLILVLVMMLGVLPMASAAGQTITKEVTLSEAQAGITLNGPQPTPSNPDIFKYYDYVWNGDTIANSLTVKPSTVGEHTYTCEVWVHNTDGTKYTVDYTFKVKVVADSVPVTSVDFASSTYELVVGGTEHLTPQVKPTDATDSTLNYSVADSSVISVKMDANGKFATITGLKVGTTTITATAADGSGKSDTATVIVKAPAMTDIAVTGNNTVKVGEELTLTAAALPTDAVLTEGATYTWSVSIGTGSVTKKTNSTGSSQTIVGEAPGTVFVTVSDGTHTSEAFTVTVEESDETYTVAMKPAELSLVLGEVSDALSVEVKNSENVVVSEGVTTANWTSSDNTVATVGSDYKVTASSSKNGTANITCDVLVNGEKVGTATCAVTVSGSALTCEGASVAVGSSTTLEPTLKFGDTAATNVVYTFTKTEGTATVDTDGKITSSKAGLVKISVDVTSYKLNGTTVTASGDKDIDPIVVPVRFFETHDLEVTLKEGKTSIDFTDSDVFSKVVVDDVVKGATATAYSLKSLFSYVLPSNDTTPSAIYFSKPSSSSPGKITDAWGYALESCSWINLSKVEFRQASARTGTTGFTYKIVDSNGLTMVDGICKITIAGGEGDIHYETTYNKPVTLKEADFQAFWNSCDLPSQYKLEYVKFDTSTLVGKLYVDSSKKTEVTSSMKFYLSPTGSQYDLGDVYYVPLKTKTTEYIDSMNFTAVDNYGSKSQYGTVTFGLNTSSDEITSRGLIFKADYAKEIADTYNTNTGKTLGYVVFDLPQAKYGKMYSSLPTSGGITKVADGVALKSTDKLYYDPSGSQFSLAKAAFIPAAGYAGEVELSYTAYDQNGNNAYAGILRLKVVTKSASAVFTDITAKSYSWAADSADFLYYEGTAQGSNGKYNPKANITRQDFMLMLYRAFLAEEYGKHTVTSNFPDVAKPKNANDTYAAEIYQAVGVAKYLGIAQGTNERFNPKSNITRQEAMVLIYRTLDTINRDLAYTSGVKASSFKDYRTVSSWATEAIANLVGHGVILGTNEKLNPKSNITRAEMACILHRVITY